jgi:hypothetical protein
MDTNATAFTSTLAAIKYGAANVPQPVEYVLGVASQLSGWQLLFSFFALLIAYDQCVYPNFARGLGAGAGADCRPRVVHLSKGVHRRSFAQDALYWSLLGIGEP